MKNYTIQYDNKHNYEYSYNLKYPVYIISYHQVICIVWFLIYNLLGYYDIDITFIIQDRRILKLIYLLFTTMSILCLIDIFLFKTMI